jgi:NADH-quinone oxidoreductase subunit L
MGGLRKKLPWTHGTFLVACLAIAGVPPLSGFFSKDEILAAAWDNGHYLVFATAMFVAGLTAFYMFRLYFMTFWSRPQDHHRYEHAHESPRNMLLPLVALAVPSVLAGFLPFGHYVNRGDLGHHGINWFIAGPAIAVGLIGIAVAYLLYVLPNEVPARLAYAFGPFHKVVFNKFYVDEIYLFITKRIVFKGISAPFNVFDRKCVDGFMDLSAQASRLAGQWLRFTVTGHLQTYLLWMVAGAAVLALVIWQKDTSLPFWLGLAGLLAVVVVFAWQFVLVLQKKSEPLKRIDRD